MKTSSCILTFTDLDHVVLYGLIWARIFAMIEGKLTRVKCLVCTFQCQLGSAPEPRNPSKDKRVCLMDGWNILPH